MEQSLSSLFRNEVNALHFVYQFICAIYTLFSTFFELTHAALRDALNCDACEGDEEGMRFYVFAFVVFMSCIAFLIINEIEFTYRARARNVDEYMDLDDIVMDDENVKTVAKTKM